jgi:hypothetical protein
MGEQSFRNSGEGWNVVSRFTEAVIPEERFLYELEQFFATYTIEFMRLEYEKKYKAIVLSLADLVVSVKGNAKDLFLEDISEIPKEAADQLIFHSSIDDHSILSNLFVNQMFRPQQKKTSLWVGVHQSPKTTRPLNHLYRSYGITESEGTLKIRQRTGELMVFDLFKFPSTKEHLKRSLAKGALRKIPETGDNLSRREEWFRRRFGRNE